MRFLITLILAGLLLSCNRKDRHSEAAMLYKESMAIHDQVMPRMDELFALSKKLDQRLDTLLYDSVANATAIAKTRLAVEQLTRADKAMMDWMHNIKDIPGSEPTSGHHHGSHQATTTENLAEEDILKIQHHQKEEIKKIRKDMDESMENAKHLLGIK